MAEENTMKSSTQERLARERDFHNARFTEENRTVQSKYYFAIAEAIQLFRRRFAELAIGSDVLEYGCGKANNSLQLASRAKHVTGIDISEVAVHDAIAKAEKQGASNTAFLAMNAEALKFPDAKFDFIFGSGIIHHLDVERSMHEIRRVLRPDGAALFLEPLGHNPIINLYRRITPNARTEDEHPLHKADIRIMQKHFASVTVKRYGLMSLLSVPVRNTKIGVPLRNILSLIDRGLFRLPIVRWWCWYTIIELRPTV